MAPAKSRTYEAQFKQQVITYTEDHDNRAAVTEFKVYKSMVQRWRKLENELRQVKKTQLSFHGNKARWKELEDLLERMITDQKRTSTANELRAHSYPRGLDEGTPITGHRCEQDVQSKVAKRLGTTDNS